MKERLSVRQICFILIAYNAVLKLIIYPSAMASASGNDLIFPALFDLAVQTVIIWSIAYLSSRTDKSFFELIEGTFNKTVARVVYALFALYFVLAAIVPMVEQQLLVHAAFYDTVPSLYVFLPFFIFSVYAG
ncbi:MAG: GerAB/ArcD/ProY family transporter, partial [Candidatus Coproplasma sp.]